MSTPYRSIPKMLAAREDFIGNSMSGMRVKDSENVQIGDSDVLMHVEPGDYIVWSYRTIIAVRKADGTVYVTSESWGNTTARHKNLCRAWL